MDSGQIQASSSGGGIENDDVQDYGLTQVYAPTGGGKVDIVFVHGLNGHPKKTWTAEKSQTFWPLQLLPPILAEQRARILVYGYDATVTSFTDGVSKDKIHNHAENLVAALSANRRIRNAKERPIIFVAHSLGGLVVKRALIYSSGIRGTHTEHLRSIYVSTFGVLFMGTPHKGSDIAKWGSLLESICRGVMPTNVVDSNPNLVSALKRENETLQVIDREFYQMISRFRVYFFHEGKKTNLGKMKMDMIVDEESASPNAPDVERSVIQQDHRHMSKFENDSAPGFDLVADALQRYADEAPGVVAIRWQHEQAERLTHKKYWLEENVPDALRGSLKSESSTATTPSTGRSPKQLPGIENQRIFQNEYEVEEVPDISSAQFTHPKSSPKTDVKDSATNTPESPKPTEAYFVVTPGFRPNSFFVGMEKELRELESHLFDKRRRAAGTACVLLHGQPGGGKTHLARQYVNKNQKRFPGGIFWINATSKEEMYHAFSNIKQRVLARDAPEFCKKAYGNDVTQPVKDWFQSRQEWLIVFDGVSIEKDEDLTALNNFVPDSRNSSLIYVSRAKNLESKQRLLRPYPIKVGPLRTDEARKLLFKTLSIKNPTDAEKKKANELVKNVGGLPMAIDAICHRISDTHEPLAKFKLSYVASPGLESTYNQIFDDLLNLNHMAAWNLINIICWFGQNIPVEMIRLGLRILKAHAVEVRSKEDIGEPNINSTFSILMRYALVERNEPGSDKDSSNSSSSSLNEPEPIDMLKVHSVVQNFCCDSLNSRSMLPQYLGYAIKLWSFSYHQADIKIKQQPEFGRVSDYRYYLIHGQHLWDHIESYESRSQNLENLRQALDPVLELIKDEISKREPTSSQESLRKCVFQMSIFDRTSSSSDSVPSAPGPQTPKHHKTPPPLDGQSIFGMPLDKEIDSPASFETATPGLRPKIVGLSPNARHLDYEDAGYESDGEAQKMRRDGSQVTERPQSRHRAPTGESQNSGWELMPNPRRTKRPPRDLGSFRPTAAKAQVNRQSVAAAISEPIKENQRRRRDSSPAQDALKEVQNRSPSSSASGVASFFQRGLFSSKSGSENQKPTWANIAAGLMPSKRTSDGNGSKQAYASPAPPQHNTATRKEDVTSRAGSSSQSPLATEFIPRPELDNKNGQVMEGDFTLFPADNEDPLPMPSYPGDLPATFHRPVYQQGQKSYQIPFPSTRPLVAPPPLGPNQAPLPIDGNVTITSSNQRPHSVAYPLASSSALSQSLPPDSNQPLYFPPYQVSGYTSQPMSRDASHQSHASIAATEPPPYPTASDFSPYIPPRPAPSTDPIPHPYPYRAPSPSQYTNRPLPPSHLTPPSNTATPPQPALSAFMPPPYPNPAPTDTAAANNNHHSRSSSSGGALIGAPGLAIESPAGGLGIISFASNTQLQFGAQDPISVEEARRRVLLLEREQREQQEQQERERLRRGSAPAGSATMQATMPSGIGAGPFTTARSQAYPQHNLIPTTSDAGALREMMVQQAAGGEKRRFYPAENLIPTGSDAGALREMVMNGSQGGGNASGRVQEEDEEGDGENEFPPLP